MTGKIWRYMGKSLDLFENLDKKIKAVKYSKVIKMKNEKRIKKIKENKYQELFGVKKKAFFSFC